MKRFVALFLVFSLVMLSANLYAKERRGAILIIQRIGDQVKQVKKTRLEGTPWETSVITDIRGELIAVKQNSLLLLDTEGKEVSLDIADIKVIRVVKKSKALLGAGIGSAAGTLIGIITAAIFDASFYELVTSLGYFIFAASGLGIGALVGALIGASAGKYKTIRIEGMSDSEIEEALEKLRKKARIRDYK